MKFELNLHRFQFVALQKWPSNPIDIINTSFNCISSQIVDAHELFVVWTETISTIRIVNAYLDSYRSHIVDLNII